LSSWRFINEALLVNSFLSDSRLLACSSNAEPCYPTIGTGIFKKNRSYALLYETKCVKKWHPRFDTPGAGTLLARMGALRQ